MFQMFLGCQQRGEDSLEMDHEMVGIVKAQAHRTAELMVMGGGGVEPWGVLVCRNMERWIRGNWRKAVITT